MGSVTSSVAVECTASLIAFGQHLRDAAADLGRLGQDRERRLDSTNIGIEAPMLRQVDVRMLRCNPLDERQQPAASIHQLFRSHVMACSLIDNSLSTRCHVMSGVMPLLRGSTSKL